MRFVLVLVLTACTTQSTGITQSEISCDSTLTYANFGQAFMATNCGSCHGARTNPNLSTQAAVQSNSSRIIQAAVYTTTMPANGDLSTEERTMLGQWLSCGAP